MALGFLREHTHWSSCDAGVDIPDAKPAREAKEISIDYIGAALLVLGTVPLLLGFTWAGTQYDWSSPQIIGLFAWSLLT